VTDRHTARTPGSDNFRRHQAGYRLEDGDYEPPETPLNAIIPHRLTPVAPVLPLPGGGYRLFGWIDFTLARLGRRDVTHRLDDKRRKKSHRAKDVQSDETISASTVEEIEFAASLAAAVRKETEKRSPSIEEVRAEIERFNDRQEKIWKGNTIRSDR
jgi:hypothetical protein